MAHPLEKGVTKLNGFGTADEALQKGLAPQVSYMGATHYVTNDNAANHLFAGVRKTFRLGLLLSLEGRTFEVPFPAGPTTAGYLSGLMFYIRRDEGTLTPNYATTLLYDVNIA